MSDGIVFTKETSKLLVNWTGDAIKPHVPFLARGLVKPVLGIVFNLVSKFGDRIIPDRVDVYINEALTKAKAGDFDGAGKTVGIGVEILVSAKANAGSAKRKFFINIGETLMSGIEFAIEAKQAA